VQVRWLLILLLLSSGKLFSQNYLKDADRFFGLDQTLYNGKKYTYSPPPASKGHPFLTSRTYTSGTVTLKDHCYCNAFLNYDLLNQQLLLKYKDETGTLVIIEVSKAWLTKFTLGDQTFEYLDIKNNPQFYQVLGDGKMKILYYWRKSLDVDLAIGSYYLLFSSPIRESFLLMNGQMQPFHSKQGLLRLLEPQKRDEVKRFMRKNKVRLNKATDKEITDLINFIDQPGQE
jgi:hypothetical protein